MSVRFGYLNQNIAFGVAEREVNKVVLQFYKNPKFETFETIVIGTADYIDKLVEMVDRENELRLEAQEHTMHVDVLASINGEWEKSVCYHWILRHKLDHGSEKIKECLYKTEGNDG